MCGRDREKGRGLCITTGHKLQCPGGGRMCSEHTGLPACVGKWNESPGDPNLPGTGVGVERRGLRIKACRGTRKVDFASFL